jgi:tripartite-type tricarboxylate transporter receptor subunit TctC
MLARLLAEQLAPRIGQAVVVENRPGAAGNIAVDLVAKATDGHTIGISPNGPLSSSPHLYPKLPYNPERDLAPISLVATSPMVLAAPAQYPASDIREAMLYARNQGDKLNYGSVGAGSASHLAMELLKIQTGIRPVHIPFNGFPAVVTAMIGGQIELSFLVPSIALPHVRSGRLKLFGVSSGTRSILVPDMEPIATGANVPRFDVEVWNGIIAPKSMHHTVQARLAQHLYEILRIQTVRDSLFAMSWQAVGSLPAGLSQRMRSDSATWGGVVRMAQIKLD